MFHLTVLTSFEDSKDSQGLQVFEESKDCQKVKSKSWDLFPKLDLGRECLWQCHHNSITTASCKCSPNPVALVWA